MAVDVKTEGPGRPGILDAAARRFVIKGYAAATVREIAGDLDIKAASIYHHFANKEALMVGVLERGIEVMHNAFDAVDPDADLEAYVRAHLEALFEHGPFTAAHVTAFFTTPPEVRAEVIRTRDRYEMRWKDVLAAHLPHLSAGQRSVLRSLLFGAMNATVEWFDPAGDLNLDDLATVIADQFMDGVAE